MPAPEKTTLYWPKGVFFWKPKVMYAEGFLLDGKRHGKWVFWYQSGNKQLEGEYVAGEKSGRWVKWNESGGKITEGDFLHGKMHGKWKDWYANGQPAQESHWHFGKKDGKWTRWDSGGKIDSVEEFDYHGEADQGYCIHTDLEEREIVREIQKKHLHRHWERHVGRTVASLVKPWHIGCWMLVFLVAFSLIQAKTPWRSAGLAGIIALLVTSVLAWTSESRKQK
jgi:hypothetical protein